MKHVKILFLLLGMSAFVVLIMVNVKLGLADYDKSSSSLLTLEALANDNEDGESIPPIIIDTKYCIMYLDCYKNGHKTGKKYRACIANGTFDCVQEN